MKNITLLLIAFFTINSNFKLYAQNDFPVGKELITVKGDTVTVNDILSDQKPKLLFFCFTGCKGCKISLDQTLINHYKEWEDKYGVQIIAISGDKESNRTKAIESFKKYPFDLYFDIEKELFALMPETPWKGKRIKAYPTLVYINSYKRYKAIDTWNADIIEAELKQ